jgi:hypothetical protein
MVEGEKHLERLLDALRHAEVYAKYMNSVEPDPAQAREMEEIRREFNGHAIALRKSGQEK